MDIIAVIALFPGLSQVELVTWIERGWVLPDAAQGGFTFHEIDIARVRLILDLRRGMDVDEDVIALVLSLLDQVYELRSRMKSVLHALEAQPRDVQTAVLSAMGLDPVES